MKRCVLPGTAGDDKVIGIPYHPGLAAGGFIDPVVQRVEIDIGQQWRDDPALRKEQSQPVKHAPEDSRKSAESPVFSSRMELLPMTGSPRADRHGNRGLRQYGAGQKTAGINQAAARVDTALDPQFDQRHRSKSAYPVVTLVCCGAQSN